MEYKGDIKGFPSYIVNIMLDEQEKQGNKRDVSIFEYSRCEIKSGGGFDWHSSTINEDTLNEVIGNRRFNLIKDPEKVDIYPKVMYVSDDSDEDALIDKLCKVVLRPRCHPGGSSGLSTSLLDCGRNSVAYSLSNFR